MAKAVIELTYQASGITAVVNGEPVTIDESARRILSRLALSFKRKDKNSTETITLSALR